MTADVGLRINSTSCFTYNFYQPFCISNFLKLPLLFSSSVATESGVSSGRSCQESPNKGTDFDWNNAMNLNPSSFQTWTKDQIQDIFNTFVQVSVHLPQLFLYDLFEYWLIYKLMGFFTLYCFYPPEWTLGCQGHPWRKNCTCLQNVSSTAEGYFLKFSIILHISEPNKCIWTNIKNILQLNLL